MALMQTQEYKTRIRMKYDGKVYEPGEKIILGTGDFDQQLIDCKHVLPVTDAQAERKAKIALAQRRHKQLNHKPDPVLDILAEAGFDTAEKIAAATDEQLLAVKGIGKSRLAAIRKEN